MDSVAPETDTREPSRRNWWPIVLLGILLIVDCGYRAHTLGPGLNGIEASEPLDCDEAAYGYIGHRLLRGDVMYRDLTENKPPLGYWIYALGVALGGYNELAIRILALPFVLGTISLLYWLGGKLGGPLAAFFAGSLYVLLSTDPYLFGNGSNMEHFMNFFSVAALALMVRSWNDGGRGSLLAAGACLGAATLVKQVAILPLPVFVVFLLAGRGRPIMRRLTDSLVLVAGAAVIMAAAAGILAAQGAGAAAYEDIMQYGKALATDTLPEPHQPSGLYRWLTGNADPNGRLPWPFGNTTYLVWWGTGSWPLWLAAVPCVAYLSLGGRMSWSRRLAACWTIAAALQVVLPGLYWQHYYLLPTPGIALAVAVALADAVSVLKGWTATKPRRFGRLAMGMLSLLVLSAAIAGTSVIQVRSYLLVAPEELTIRYKGGLQWVKLRLLGQELARRTVNWPSPPLYVWGWQSPLHFYGKLDGPTRHFFVDNLLRDQAERDHPLIKPRIEEIMRSLHERPPALVFAGYRPFPALAAWLRKNYAQSRLSAIGDLGLWVERSRYADFENAVTGHNTKGSGNTHGISR